MHLAINKHMRAALRVLSYPAAMELDKVYKVERAIYQLKAPPLSALYRHWDHKIESVDGTPIRVRIYTPRQQTDHRVLLFFHGGGWVLENVDTYNQVCKALAKATGCRVASVEYRRAPEHPFPMGLEDCYAAAKAIYTAGAQLGTHGAEDIILIGDSAGANLAAAVSLLARDRGEFTVSQQILIYPATAADHSETSPFPSVRENGEGYLLTAFRVEQFMRLYAGMDDSAYQNPYFAPLLMQDLSRQPRTLLITAEYDPLRDEGEAYARALAEAGNPVRCVRMADALHGFLSLPSRFVHVKRTHALIREFLGDEMKCADSKNQNGTASTTRRKFSRRRFTGRIPQSFD